MAEEVKRRFLTFWNSVKFLVDYANVQGFRPAWSELEPQGELVSLDRWLVERTNAFVPRSRRGYEAYETVAVMREFEAYVDDLSNWYIRRSRPPLLGGGRGGAADALVRARPDAARLSRRFSPL
jgi:isoleucyl-tRNA synthetase